MFSVIGRYFGKEFLKYFAAVLLFVSSVIFVFDFIELSRVSANKNISFDITVLLALLKTPIHVQKIIIFALFFGALITFNKLSQNSEIVVLKAAGYSMVKLITPMFLTAIIIGLVYVALLNPLISYSAYKYNKLSLKYLKNTSNPLSLTTTGLWIKQDDGKNRILHALRIDKKNKKLIDITFYNMSDDGIFNNRISAEYARYINHKWYLKNATISDNEKVNAPLEKDYVIDSVLSFTQIENSLVNPESLSFWGLPEYINIAELSGFPSIRYKLQFLDLLMKPIFFAIMVILAAAFAINHPRLHNSGKMLFLAIMIGFLVYFTTDLAYAFTIAGKVSLLIGALIPLSVCLIMSVLIILYREESA